MKSKIFRFNQPLGGAHTGVLDLEYSINEWLANQSSAITIEFINNSENFVIIFYRRAN